MNGRTRCVAGVLAILLVPAQSVWSAKTDKVLIVNGDRITGEVKSLDQGILIYSTDSMSKVSVEWEDVRGLTSPSYFEIDLRTGERIYGSLGSDVGLDSLAVTIGNITRRIPVVDVVQITPIRRTFWGRIDGSLSIGLSYTKATTLGQFTFDSRTQYTAEKNRVEFEVLTIISNQEGQERKDKVDVGLTYIRLLRERWLAAANSTAERDDELGIAFRASGGLGGGYVVLHTSHMRLYTLGGVTGNREYAKGEEPAKTNLELTLSLNYALFKYNTPKTNLNVGATGYANLNTKDRYRFNTNISGRHELIKDFFFSLTFYGDLDTKSPESKGRQSDYGVVSSVGWTY